MLLEKLEKKAFPKRLNKFISESKFTDKNLISKRKRLLKTNSGKKKKCANQMKRLREISVRN